MDTCIICDYATEHGHWPMSGTHCGDSRGAGITGCHRSWTSTAQAHCVVCHGQFATNGVADLHWREPKGRPPVHLDPATVVYKTGENEGKPYLVSRDDGKGPIWHQADYREPRIFGPKVYGAVLGAVVAPSVDDSCQPANTTAA